MTLSARDSTAAGSAGVPSKSYPESFQMHIVGTQDMHPGFACNGYNAPDFS